MPELPEVETVRRLIDPEIVGKRITSVTLRDFTAVLESAIPGVDPATTMLGTTIRTTGRRGKYLLIHLDADFTLIVHLRMTGRLLLMDSGAAPVRFEHLIIGLESGSDLRFADQRKFGRVVVATEEAVDALDRRLGLEPNAPGLTSRTLHAALQRRPGKIKNALLDQSLIAGLGNIYVDEALFRCRIHPERPSNSLSLAECSSLLRSVRHVINVALGNQGTTFSSFENPYGEAGGNAPFLRAYGRAGLPCLRCGAIMLRTVVSARGTTFCPVCQVRDASFPEVMVTR